MHGNKRVSLSDHLTMILSQVKKLVPNTYDSRKMTVRSFFNNIQAFFIYPVKVECLHIIKILQARYYKTFLSAKAQNK